MAGSMAGSMRKKYSAIIFLVEIHLARGGFCLGVSARGVCLARSLSTQGGVSGWMVCLPRGCLPGGSA